VLASYQENFAIAVVEALASSTPVIISDQVQIHACVTRGRVGAVVPTEIEPLRAAIARWLDDDALRLAAARRAREFVFNEFDEARSARRWSSHYARVTAAATAARRAPAMPLGSAPLADPFGASSGAAGRGGVAALARHHAS
jgi:glycosyltransferase involved in cell wall biosynthesis